MADDEALPDFPDERRNDADTEVPTAPAGPEDDSGDVGPADELGLAAARGVGSRAVGMPRRGPPVTVRAWTRAGQSGSRGRSSWPYWWCWPTPFSGGAVDAPPSACCRVGRRPPAVRVCHARLRQRGIRRERQGRPGLRDQSTASAQIAVRQRLSGDAPRAFVDVVVTESESAIAPIESSFGGVDPPSPADDDLRGAASAAVEDAGDALSRRELRSARTTPMAFRLR